MRFSNMEAKGDKIGRNRHRVLRVPAGASNRETRGVSWALRGVTVRSRTQQAQIDVNVVWGTDNSQHVQKSVVWGVPCIHQWLAGGGKDWSGLTPG